MTYHPVTKEELEQIRLEYDATKIMNEVLTRTDPLEVLEKWFEKGAIKYWEMGTLNGWVEFDRIIKELRTNPDAVIKRGKEEGWLK